MSATRVAPLSPPEPAPAASQDYRYANLDESGHGNAALADEAALAIAYNGISQAVMLVSPRDLEDFVVGFSLASGIVPAADDIYDIQLQGLGASRQAQVEISSRAFWALKDHRRQMAGTTGCGLCGVEAMDQALPDLPVLAPAPLPPAQWLQGLRQRISDLQPLGQHSGAVHAAAFMNKKGELLLAREDIGRHNAMDKLIGALVRQGIDTAGGLVVVTSRCSLELIQKMLRAGISTLVSLSSPTGLACQWARQHRLNLIHLPHHSAPRVYSPAMENQP
ncbi:MULTISPECIES: formate dehydrogenase accessory sulfurtransferase FdhD [Pseudomonas]|uniref:Sulfur carrier protein FdhD n=1 Tax=Pseudomonas quercus TaxID=2722792 RepID=A0ABX0YEZ2_9PSED|nr:MULTISPECIES: formate dehydrogenase accessory sulfurtransferase FdhD [Pseudomonas]MBF7142238.1 formate dehydrogenase accessory sulfurtransferase FdhD [Pseudomonas sp. LY10J]NJP00776.1 formate dehydrogenase accessory sulfurtransferase FdhD [Pseudomonas quercus]